MLDNPQMIVFSDTQTFRKMLGMYRALCIEANLSDDEVKLFSILLIQGNLQPALDGLAWLYNELGQKLGHTKQESKQKELNYSLMVLAVLLIDESLSLEEKETCYQIILRAITTLDHKGGIPIEEVNERFEHTIVVEARDELYELGKEHGMSKDDVTAFLQSFRG